MFSFRTGNLVKGSDLQPIGVASLEDYKENDQSLLPSLRYTSAPLIEA